MPAADRATQISLVVDQWFELLIICATVIVVVFLATKKKIDVSVRDVRRRGDHGDQDDDKERE